MLLVAFPTLLTSIHNRKIQDWTKKLLVVKESKHTFTKDKELICAKRGWKHRPIFRNRCNLSCLTVAARFIKEGKKGKKKSFKKWLKRALSKGAWPAGMHEKPMVREHSEPERFALESALVFQLWGSKNVFPWGFKSFWCVACCTTEKSCSGFTVCYEQGLRWKQKGKQSGKPKKNSQGVCSGF